MRGSRSITGITFSSQLAIATSQIAENLLNYVEALSFAIVKMQIQNIFAVFAPDIILRAEILPASVRCPAKCGLFCWRLLLVYRSGLSTGPGSDFGGFRLHAKGGDGASHV